MKALFEIKDVDRRFYEERLRGFLPDRLIDIHAHVWLERFALAAEAGSAQRSVTWPARVAMDCSVEDLVESYRLMLPGKRVTPLMFSTIGIDLEQGNAYVRECSARRGFPSLIFSKPDWSGEEFERRIVEGGFLGAKSYLEFAPCYLATAEIRILDFFPPHQLEVMDRRGWIMMLHIPRPARLRDPVNLAQLLHIEQRYPGVELIVAHVGRAYCPEDVGNAFEVLAPTRRLLFDIAANTNDGVFEQAICAVGPKRILFGSDQPISRMRMRRICRGGTYVNLVPKGLYGDVSGDRNMGELEGEEAEKLTFFLYEQIDAFRRAAERVSLTRGDIEDVFCGNARRVLEPAAPG